MKILYISSWFFGYVINLANLMSERGEVYLFLPNNTGKEYVDSIRDDVNTYFFELPQKFFSFQTVYMIYDLLRRINNIDPDIVHFQTTSHMLFLFLFFRKFKLISTFHDVKIHEGEKSLLFRQAAYFAAKLSRKVFVHGKQLKKQIINEYKIPEDKVRIVPLGEDEFIEFKKYERNDLTENGNLILFFGRIYRYKGLEYLIKAEPLITNAIPEAKIVIAGRGEDFGIYEDMMVNKNNFIVYNEHISFEKGTELIQKSSVIVLPYIEASQSGIIPVAYGLKRPVIATDVGSIPEVIDNNETGIIIKPHDHKALAEATIQLMKNPDLRKEMGNKGYEKLKKELSGEANVVKTYETYQEIIKNH
ncbi:glycosyltransferase family 4 protein [uncultured Methanobacterium sp.]|uniref:glycosyltransferase family 4 protein n=1 Tax=uncultured Methanobacterium sp. TaxID=176306 RepID=UPI002AA64016|nr:glycosyltransferase family 4 protein [uncultured Methanobacterium sp.]